MPVPHFRPWLRFHLPLIKPDVRISRIRLSDKDSCFRPRNVAVAQAESIVFRVDGELECEVETGSALRGRALLCAVAAAILRPRRGQIAVHSLDSGNRVELTVPAVRPERA